MLNQVVLVGRLTKEPTTEKLESGMLTSVICLATPRNYKNENGEYETDFIDIRLFSDIAENTTNYCKQGDLVGIKGRLSKLPNEKLQVIAERVTFLSSEKSKESGEK